jgi:hypothetical protein
MYETAKYQICNIGEGEDVKNIYNITDTRTDGMSETVVDFEGDAETSNTTRRARNAFLKVIEKQPNLFCKGDVSLSLIGIQTPPDDDCLFHALAMGLVQPLDTLKSFEINTSDRFNNFHDGIPLGEVSHADLQKYLRYCLSALISGIFNPALFSKGRTSWGNEKHIECFIREFHIPILVLQIVKHNEPEQDKNIVLEKKQVSTSIYPPFGLVNYTDYHFELMVYEGFQPLYTLFPEFVIFQLKKIGKGALEILKNSANRFDTKNDVVEFINGILAKL